MGDTFVFLGDLREPDSLMGVGDLYIKGLITVMRGSFRFGTLLCFGDLLRKGSLFTFGDLLARGSLFALGDLSLPGSLHYSGGLISYD